MTNTAFTCIDVLRSIFQKQFTAGPVEKRVFAFIPTPATGDETIWTELLSVRLGITFALRMILASSNGTQANAQISLML